MPFYRSNIQASPAGNIAHFAGATAPAGWLACNGATVSRTAYAALFAAIGTTYGAGDGATTFALPDLRDDFVRGASASRPVGTRATDSTRSHTHSYSDGGLYGVSSIAGVFYQPPPGDNLPTSQDIVRATQATGGAETAPRHVAMLACIKY